MGVEEIQVFYYFKKLREISSKGRMVVLHLLFLIVEYGFLGLDITRKNPFVVIIAHDAHFGLKHGIRLIIGDDQFGRLHPDA